MNDRDKQALIDALAGDGEVKFDEPMARHTTLRIGGPVDVWVEPTSVASLARVRKACAERGLVGRAFGSGSNLLVRDGGVRGVAFSLRKMTAVAVDGGEIAV